MAFIGIYPILQNMINNDIDNFIKNDEFRNKKNAGDIGEFIIKCFLSSKYSFEDIKSVLLKEYYARQILWIQKKGINTNNLTVTKLQNAFEACKISNQLLIFGIESSKTFIFNGVCKKLDDRNGFPPDSVIESFQNKIKDIKIKVNNFSLLTKIVGMNINSADEMVAFFNEANQLSIKQKYTK
jgi:hypothetical protein